MSNISLTNGATYTFNSNGEIISNENKCVSFKYFSETESEQLVTLTLNDYLTDNMYGFEAYLGPYLVTGDEEFNSLINRDDIELAYPGTITFNMRQYEYVVFRFYNPGNYENTGYDIIVNGTLYEVVHFSGGDNLYKYGGLDINDNLVGSDEIVIEIREHGAYKPIYVSFSDNYSNDITYIYLSDDENDNYVPIEFDGSGEYDLRRYNRLHITGNVVDHGHLVEISVEPGLAKDVKYLELYGIGEIDVEIPLKGLVYPSSNDSYYESIDYVNIHFKMGWDID